MVIESFMRGARPVYQRAAERGRMLPPGLVYVDSWIDERTLDRCFQLMETEDASLFDEWIASWSDLGHHFPRPQTRIVDLSDRDLRDQSLGFVGVEDR